MACRPEESPIQESSCLVFNSTGAAAPFWISSVFGEHDVPSTLLGVTVLGWRGQLVEIEAVAVAGP